MGEGNGGIRETFGIPMVDASRHELSLTLVPSVCKIPPLWCAIPHGIVGETGYKEMATRNAIQLFQRGPRQLLGGFAFLHHANCHTDWQLKEEFNPSINRNQI